MRKVQLVHSPTIESHDEGKDVPSDSNETANTSKYHNLGGASNGRPCSEMSPATVTYNGNNETSSQLPSPDNIKDHPLSAHNANHIREVAIR